MDQTIDIPTRFCGPPNIAHGGYVAGLLADGVSGAVQVTLRKPSPLGVPLTLRELGDGKRALLNGDLVTAELEPGTLSLEVPRPPTLAEARAAEAGSPVHRVHGRCFGCGRERAPGDALGLYVGPCLAHGVRQLACAFRPDASLCEGGLLQRRFVFAALDCPGAMAFLADDKRAGLLGRIVIEQHAPVPAGEDLLVTAWQIGEEGRKMFAGTALHSAEGQLLAAARATWFGF
jgi:hypothetical protein